ncbi:MAG: beta-ketoacyl-ACP synthase III [Bacteroidia bacterium]|nr:ketoacyl-ACP synthase III [Bacteroidia bacterium]MDW8157455.1 beta-ketoacyl-ACP synthase III [Bacteroidia bacterium]
MPKACIRGIGAYLPEYTASNSEFEKFLDTSETWILERTGIQQRKIQKTGEGTAHMAIQAVGQLLQKTNLAPQDIDLLICATVTPDYLFPATAQLITEAIGASRAWGYDLQAACASFLYGLVTGAQFIESGHYQNVVIVGADTMSSILDYEDRTTCVIFGDGAACVLLQPSEKEGIHDFILQSDGKGAIHLHMKAGGSALPPSKKTVSNRLHFVYQEGKPVFKQAIKSMCETTLALLDKNNLQVHDIDWLVPHQANLRIIEAVAHNLQFPLEKVMINIQNYGNTTSATLPLCLSDWEKKLKSGDKLILTAFGGGFAWGAVYLTWAY